MDWQPLDPRAKILFYLQAFGRLFWLGAPFCAFGTGVLASVAPTWIAITVGIAVAFLLLLLTLWMPALAHSRWAYALREDDLMIQRGIFVRHLTAIPRCRVQHVDIKQGPIEQWLNLSRVRIHTASGLRGDGVIPGLNPERSEYLRDQLLGSSHDDGV